MEELRGEKAIKKIEELIAAGWAMEITETKDGKVYGIIKSLSHVTLTEPTRFAAREGEDGLIYVDVIFQPVITFDKIDITFNVEKENKDGR